MGYDGVELAGLYGHTAVELKKTLDEVGLEFVSAHVPLAELEKDEVLDDYAAAGLPVVSTQRCKEYIDLLTKYYAGFSCTNEGPAEIAQSMKLLVEDENLRVKMGGGSRRMAEEVFDRKCSYRLIADEIMEIR